MCVIVIILANLWKNANNMNSLIVSCYYYQLMILSLMSLNSSDSQKLSGHWFYDPPLNGWKSCCVLPSCFHGRWHIVFIHQLGISQFVSPPHQKASPTKNRFSATGLDKSWHFLWICVHLNFSQGWVNVTMCGILKGDVLHGYHQELWVFTFKPSGASNHRDPPDVPLYELSSIWFMTISKNGGGQLLL